MENLKEGNKQEIVLSWAWITVLSIISGAKQWDKFRTAALLSVLKIKNSDTVEILKCFTGQK